MLESLGILRVLRGFGVAVKVKGLNGFLPLHRVHPSDVLVHGLGFIPWDPKTYRLGVRHYYEGVITYYFVGFGDTGRVWAQCV